MNAPIFILAVLLSAASLAEGGTVTGTVIAFPQKYAAETVVYLRDAPPPKSPRRRRGSQRLLVRS